MVIINSDKKCQACFRIFFSLETHHKNGNHLDNKEENIIELCKDCYNSVNKPVSIGKMRSYQGELVEGVIENLYNLRVELHKSKYGHTNFIPQDFITETFFKNKKIELFFEKTRKDWADIKEIHYC